MSDSPADPLVRTLLAALLDGLPLAAAGAAALAAAFLARGGRRPGFALASLLSAATVAILLPWRLWRAGDHGGEHLFTLLGVYLPPLLPLAAGARLLGEGTAAAILRAVRDLVLLVVIAVAVLVVNGFATVVPDHALLTAGLRLSFWSLLALALAAAVRDPRTPTAVRRLPLLALLAATEPLAVLVAGGANPFLSGEDVGLLPIVNALLPGYLLPAWLLVRLARTPGLGARPAAFLAGGAALLLFLLWATLELRRAFHGAVLSGPVGAGEVFAYALLWTTVPLLLLGGFRIRRRRRQLSS